MAHELSGTRDRLPTATPTGPSLSNGDGGFFLCVGQSVEFCADLPVRKPFDQGHHKDGNAAESVFLCVVRLCGSGRASRMWLLHGCWVA
ncbi:MAG TPA: hypothetical protein VFC29_06600, partial [Candidatus Limnocylindrales bacterium]|nr:hypothetical protein [Candidatus Limnocylindrales bacterium]